jgi:hypothetical protein
MMQQLNIEYFFPLTEQIPLNLDYTECDKPKLWTTLPINNGGNGFTLMSTGSNVTWSTQLNGWDIGTKQEPSKLRKFLMKYLIGWKWVG